MQRFARVVRIIEPTLASLEEFQKRDNGWDIVADIKFNEQA